MCWSISFPTRSRGCSAVSSCATPISPRAAIVLMRFLKASIEGNYIALTDEKRAREVLAKELKISDSKILDITYDDFKQQSPLNLRPSLRRRVEYSQTVSECQPETSAITWTQPARCAEERRIPLTAMQQKYGLK